MFKYLRNKTYQLLRHSEKYTKTDMVYLTKGGFWLTAGHVISSIAILALGVAFANLLPRETYGIYRYVLSIAGILSLATLKGMDAVITQSVARGYEGTIKPALKTKISWGTIGSLFGLFIALYYYLNDNNTLAISFLITAVFLPFTDSFSIYNAFLQGKKFFRATAIYKTISQILAVIVMVATLFITKNLFIILVVYFVSWTIIRLFFYFYSIKKFSPNKENDPNTLPYGKHSSIVNATANLVGSLDAFLIFHYLGAVELAIYSFALAPILQLRGLLLKFQVLAVPKFAQRPLAQIKKVLWKRFFLLFFIGLGLAIIYILIAPFIFKIFFPKYLESILFSQVFALSMSLVLANTILGSVTNAKITITPKKLLYLWNIPNTILLISILLLIKPLGIMGVVISRFLLLISATMISLIIWNKIKNIKDEDQILTKS